jgi:hypothetical protein
MKLQKLAFATLAAMGVTAAAIAQQPSQQQTPRSNTPSTQQQPGQQPGSSSQTAPRGGDRTEQVPFERADKDSDGKLTRQEANDVEGFDFSRADTNNDASLTRQEYQAAMMSSTQRDGAGASERSGDGSAARGGAQTDQAANSSQQRAGQSQQSEQGQQGQRTAQVSFDNADKDKDGKITRAEANDIQGLDFSTADTNDDASLSRQEFQTAMAGVQPRG